MLIVFRVYDISVEVQALLHGLFDLCQLLINMCRVLLETFASFVVLLILLIQCLQVSNNNLAFIVLVKSHHGRRLSCLEWRRLTYW